jgi:hypothetical protein
LPLLGGISAKAAAKARKVAKTRKNKLKQEIGHILKGKTNKSWYLLIF